MLEYCRELFCDMRGLDTAVTHYTRYVTDNRLHRQGGPAKIVWDFGNKSIEYGYYENGFMHRLDGPAIIEASGPEAWFVKGRELRGFQAILDLYEPHRVKSIMDYIKAYPELMEEVLLVAVYNDWLSDQIANVLLAAKGLIS